MEKKNIAEFCRENTMFLGRKSDIHDGVFLTTFRHLSVDGYVTAICLDCPYR